MSKTDFLDWHRNLRIVLKHEKKMYVFDEPLPEEAPPAGAPRAESDAYSKHLNDIVEVACIMLATMTSGLQKQHKKSRLGIRGLMSPWPFFKLSYQKQVS
jgi:hypothetical protein